MLGGKGKGEWGVMLGGCPPLGWWIDGEYSPPTPSPPLCTSLYHPNTPSRKGKAKNGGKNGLPHLAFVIFVTPSYQAPQGGLTSKLKIHSRFSSSTLFCHTLIAKNHWNMINATQNNSVATHTKLLENVTMYMGKKSLCKCIQAYMHQHKCMCRARKEQEQSKNRERTEQN